MKTILVPVDFSDVTLKVVKAAVHLAKPFQSKIILMHASEPAPQLLGIGPGPDVVPIPPTHEAQSSPDYTESLASLQEMISATGLPSMTVDLQGPAVDLILAQAETSRVDLIVLGSHQARPTFSSFPRQRRRRHFEACEMPGADRADE